MENPSSAAEQSVGDRIQVTIIGAGTIGLSFAALHLSQHQNAEVTIHDTRPELEAYVYDNLSGKSRNSFQALWS